MNIAAQSQTFKQMRDWSSDGSESKKLRQYLPHHMMMMSQSQQLQQQHQPTTTGNLSKSVSNGSFSEKQDFADPERGPFAADG